tara:strand:+ start:2910 stop:3287 length:378 start_codon:yes stop_codon:yes gene_type:complete
MSWFDVLKLTSPRQFLEHFEEMLGGKVEGRSQKDRDEFKLTHDNGFIKVIRRGANPYEIHIGSGMYAGDVITVYNLEKAKEEVERIVNSEEMEKVAGSVTTQSAPTLFNHGKSMRGSDGKEDQEE